MYYNTDLSPEAPATFEEIPALCDAMSGIENCIGLPGGGDGSDAYHHYPFVSALGGYIFAYNDGVYDPTDVGLDSEGAIAGVSFLETLVNDGYVASTNYDNAKALFLAGTEPYWITGPWEVGTLNETAGLNWGVALLPTIEGQTPAPFVGAQAFFINSFSENKTVAEAFLLQYVATPETMQALYDADPRNPAYQATYEAVSSDPVAATFADSAATGQPMPNIPEMNNVWGPLGDQLRGMRNGEQDASTTMTNAATQVREAIAG
jgi:maltose-binding protein MalE